MPRKMHTPEEIAAIGARTASIALASPRENGYIESYSARPRDELLDGEIFCTLAESRTVIESCRRFNNTLRPHGSLGSRLPAPEVFIPKSARTAAIARGRQ